MNRALVGVAAGIVAFACLVSPARARADETPATPAQPTTAPAAPTSPTTEPPPQAASHRTAWPWIIMGTGIALVVTATVVEIHAVAEDDRRQQDETKFSVLQDGPAKAALVASAQSHDDSAKSGRTQALILGTVGFLAIAGSVVLWFYEGGSSSSDPPAKGAKPKPTFTPSFSPSYAGAAFGTSF